MHKRYKLWLAGALAGILVLTGSVPAYAKGTEREIGQNVETEMSGTEAESNGVFALSDDTVPAAASAEETETETNDPKRPRWRRFSLWWTVRRTSNRKSCCRREKRTFPLASNL